MQVTIALIIVTINMGTVDSLRNLDSFVEKVEKQMSHFRLFADDNSGSSENRVVKTHSNLGKLGSDANDIMTPSIKSKLVCPQSWLKFRNANKKFKFLELLSFFCC